MFSFDGFGHSVPLQQKECSSPLLLDKSVLTSSVLKSVILGVTEIGLKSEEECGESAKEDSCAVLLRAFGVLPVGALEGEASCSFAVYIKRCFGI